MTFATLPAHLPQLAKVGSDFRLFISEKELKLCTVMFEQRKLLFAQRSQTQRKKQKKKKDRISQGKSSKKQVAIRGSAKQE